MNDRDLDALSLPARVAVAAACVEHVLDFYRFGNFSLRVRHARGAAHEAPADTDLVQYALDIAWRFVQNGKVDSAIVDSVLNGLKADPDDCDPDSMSMPGMTAVDSVADVLHAISDETPARAGSAIHGGPHAIADGLRTVLRGRPDKEQEVAQAKADETAWQERVLERARTRGGAALSRADFTDLLAIRPAWHKHIAKYRAYYA